MAQQAAMLGRMVMPVFRGERRRLRANHYAQKQHDEQNSGNARGPEWHFVNYYTLREFRLTAVQEKAPANKIRIGRSAAQLNLAVGREHIQ